MGPWYLGRSVIVGVICLDSRIGRYVCTAQAGDFDYIRVFSSLISAERGTRTRRRRAIEGGSGQEPKKKKMMKKDRRCRRDARDFDCRVQGS